MNDRYTPLAPPETETETEPVDSLAALGDPLDHTPPARPQLGDPALVFVLDGTAYPLDQPDHIEDMDERTARLTLALLEMATDRAMRRVDQTRAARGPRAPQAF